MVPAIDAPAAPACEGLPLCYLRLLLEPARARGCDTENVLRSAGLASYQLANPLHLVDPRHFARTMRRLQRATKDEMLALSARRVRVGTFSLVMRQVLLCTTLGDALRLGCSLYRTIWDELTLRLRIHGPDALLEVVSHCPDNPWGCTGHLVLLYCVIGLMSWMVQQPIPLRAVSLPATLPEFPGAPPLFEQPIRIGPSGQIRFDAQWLNARVVADMEGLRTFMFYWPTRRMPPYRDNLPMTVRVRHCLRNWEINALPTLPRLAQAIGQTAKGLRRLLHEENQTYRGIVEALRCEEATRLLDLPEFTICDVGYRLGFSEPSAFRRAFKRATGQTPMEYRRRRDTLV
ncbi:AraC family transcriptional regulator [Paraburkholderia graminis]